MKRRVLVSPWHRHLWNGRVILDHGLVVDCCCSPRMRWVRRTLETLHDMLFGRPKWWMGAWVQNQLVEEGEVEP